MTFELDVTAWSRAAAEIDEIAAALLAPDPLPVPDDRYGRALGAVPSASDETAAAAHRAAVAELTDFARRIRLQASDTVDTDHLGAEQIADAW